MTTAEKRKKKPDKSTEISNPVGRPRLHDRDEIASKLHDYIEASEIPVIAEFCYKNNIRRDYLYEMANGDEGLSNALKRCIEKKEAQLEIKSLRGEVNPTQAIFSLKQMGWRDKQDIEHSGNMTHEHKHDLKKLHPKELAQLEHIIRKTADSG